MEKVIEFQYPAGQYRKVRFTAYDLSVCFQVLLLYVLFDVRKTLVKSYEHDHILRV